MRINNLWKPQCFAVPNFGVYLFSCNGKKL